MLRINNLMKTFIIVMVISQAFASRDIADGCDLPDSETTGFLHLTADGSVLYKSLYDIGGFQFNVDGTILNSASGGDAGAAGFMISTGGSMVLGFSLTGATIPAGCGTLLELNLDGDATGLIEIIMSEKKGIKKTQNIDKIKDKIRELTK